MTTTYQQARDWRGPALFSFGFRPFFLVGAIWAAGAMGIWLAMIGGWISLPTAFDSVTWHAHAFLFGYLPAIIAGFLLTAVPNWTGRLPVVGWRLGLLVSLWLIGRIAVTVSAGLPAALVAVFDLSCMAMLAVMIAREIIAGKNWKNLVVLGMLLGLIVGGALFHLEFALGGDPVHGIGLRVGLGAGVMMICVIGGRVVPSFTRNWLVKVGDPARPSPPMQGFDKVVLLVTVVALALWVVFPNHTATAFALTALGLAQALRMGRWCGHRTLRAPLVWVLHLAYAFVPLGGAAMGFAILRPDLLAPAAAQHLWMAGAVGLMTLAVMTRATLGHTGRPLSANAGTVAVYGMLVGSVLARFTAGIWPELDWLFTMSGALWCGAFFGFVLLYGPLLMRPKAKG